MAIELNRLGRMVARGRIEVLSEPSNPHQSALETAEKLQEDLEALAASDLPFAYDAGRSIEQLDQAHQEDASTK